MEFKKMHTIDQQQALWRSVSTHLRQAANYADKKNPDMVKLLTETVLSELKYLERELIAASSVSGIGEE